MEAQPDVYWSIDGTLDQMVVFVDEIDKLGQKLSSEWNEHVQANFLTLFENKAELQGITFIFAGAFTHMEKDDKRKNGIGFTHNRAEDKLKDISQKVIDCGLLPELVGRLNNIVVLDTLSKEDYTKILNDTILPKAKMQLSHYGIENFTLTEAQVDTLVDNAMASGLGVRALETGVHQILVQLEFDPTSYDDDFDDVIK